jgi:hypothetical protein
MEEQRLSKGRLDPQRSSPALSLADSMTKQRTILPDSKIPCLALDLTGVLLGEGRNRKNLSFEERAGC